MTRVLIAGCGDVGMTLAAHLAIGGHEVFGLRRNIEALPSSIEGVRADLSVPATLRDLPDQLEVVFFTAAAKTQDDETYRATYIEGLGNLLQALESQRNTLRRVFFTSSTGVYGQEDGGWVDESSATEPPRFNGKRVLQAERVLADSDLPGTSVRFGGIYGPGRTRVIEFVKSGRARCYPDPPSYTNRIHREDCAGSLVHLMQVPDPAPVYVGVDDDPALFNDLVTWLSRKLGMPDPPMEPSPRPPNKRCSNALLKASGYEFRYPSFRDGYGEIMAEM